MGEQSQSVADWLAGLQQSPETVLAVAGVPDESMALALADYNDLETMLDVAGRLRDQGFGNLVTYSKKVFIPLTHLCRDVCHYCTFAKTPKRIDAPYLSVEQVLALVRAGVEQGCKEALFTLGEKPELRYKAAREALAEMGFASTLEYVAHVAARVYEETGILPHINAGCMTADELAMLRPVSASMGIMLESASPRLCEKGMPHYGSPDKDPAVRLETLELAGVAKVPFTSGILIGIGETRRERIESLLALRRSHQRHGHLQEVIVQNFRAKPDTKMALAPEPDLEEMLWTLAVARLIFGAEMSIQAPPNLSPGVLQRLLAAGINDWGGVSPVTPDFVNPEAPWPHLQQLSQETAGAGKQLHERLTIYPRYIRDFAYLQWLDSRMYPRVLQLVDGQGYPRVDHWVPGADIEPPLNPGGAGGDDAGLQLPVSSVIKQAVVAAQEGQRLSESQIVSLFEARGSDYTYICEQADQLRAQRCGDVVRFVVNRNINYTNVCYFKCKFCAFSKGKRHEALRGQPYDLDVAEIQRRVTEAWQRGATEVCMQGGIHPDYTGQQYIDICHWVKQAVPEMHIHAFSPLEIWQGAKTLGLPLSTFLAKLKAAGLGTLPGTAAEVLDDSVREQLCADKINSAEWLQVMKEAHAQGIRTTATIMFGHIDGYRHWARHLLTVRDLQAETGGFTEFVPLPFVADESPIYLKGQARRGPTFREAVLMHAVARLVFNGQLDHVQASWVKMGPQGVQHCLSAGADDLGGTLMNESITRAAGAQFGQEHSPEQLTAIISVAGRQAEQRTTLYGPVAAELQQRSRNAIPLLPITNTPLTATRKAPLDKAAC